MVSYVRCWKTIGNISLITFLQAHLHIKFQYVKTTHMSRIVSFWFISVFSKYVCIIILQGSILVSMNVLC